MLERIRPLAEISLVVGLACLFVPAARSQAPARKEATASQSRIEKKTYDFKEAGKEMEYALFVPTTYDKEKKTPLMVALHGLGSNPQQIMRYRGLTDQAEKHGYIVVAPMGYNTQRLVRQPAPCKKKERPEEPERAEREGRDERAGDRPQGLQRSTRTAST